MFLERIFQKSFIGGWISRNSNCFLPRIERIILVARTTVLQWKIKTRMSNSIYLEAINWEKTTEDAFLEACAQHNHIVLFIHRMLIDWVSEKLKLKLKCRQVLNLMRNEMRRTRDLRIMCLRLCLCERDLKQNTSLAQLTRLTLPKITLLLMHTRVFCYQTILLFLFYFR